MLLPNERRSLEECLRPPVGFSLDCAIATTFSLDLLALLEAPLAFTMFEWQESGQRPRAADPIVLHGIRRYADRIHLFCQAGRIEVPSQYERLYTFIEDMVIEVLPPQQGVFHPKVWVLRLTSTEDAELPARYRLLCLSRNLTFDRSWDTAVALEGEVADRQRGYGRNAPLVEFVESLPGLALHAVPDQAALDTATVAQELRFVDWQPPRGVDELRFWVTGISRRVASPFGGRCDRRLVMSPFCSDTQLRQLGSGSGQDVLISRLETLEGLSRDTRKLFAKVYYLDPQSSTPDEPEAGTALQASPLAGLHAKLYISEAGWTASVLTGSANATEAAFDGNVEFLVQLRGKKSALGIDAFLGLGDDADRLQALLCEFDRDQSSATDPLLQRLEQRLERGRRMLSVAPLVAQVDMPTGGAEYKLQLVCRGEMDVDALCDLEARAWPITLSEISAKGLRPGDAALAEWPHVSCEGLTPFFAFELVARSGSSEEKQRFVLKLPLLGAPFDRGERLVRDLFANQRDLERFFLMLLADEDNPQDIFSVPADSRDQGRSRGTQYPQGVPLFEAMVRALENRPERLDEIAVWVEEFQKTPEGRRLLPSGFEELWRPLWAARQEVRQ